MPRPEPISEDELAKFRVAADVFNAGDYYAAHDLFEDLWGEDFWKGLVMASVCLHHASIGNPKGMEGLPEKVRTILGEHTPAYHGMDVERFLRDFDLWVGPVASGRVPAMDDAPLIMMLPASGSG